MNNTSPKSFKSSPVQSSDSPPEAERSPAGPPAAFLVAVPVAPDRPASGVVGTEPPPVIAEVTTAEADALNLSPVQRTVIALLIAGKTRSDAATAAGIGRTTLWRWFNDDPAFIAAFNSWQNDVRNTVQSQLLAATHEAAAVVLNAVRRGDSRLAWKLLEAQGMTVPRTAGPTDTDEVRRDADAARRKRDIAERRRQAQLHDAEDLADLAGMS